MMNKREIIMMKNRYKLINKFLSILLSAAIAFASASAVCAAPSDIPYDERPMAAETEKINDATEIFKKDLQKSNNRDQVFEDYNTLLELAARNRDIHQINVNELQKSNYGVEIGYDKAYLDKNIEETVACGEQIKAAVKSALDSRYSDDFKEYWGAERTAHVASFADQAEMEEKTKKSKEFYDSYYKLIDNGASSMEFTKLLRDIIEYGNAEAKAEGFDNYLDYIYAQDHTGFQTKDIMAYCDKVCSEYPYYVNKFKNYGTSHGLSAEGVDAEVENLLEALSYVGKIDKRLKDDYDYLVRNKLCCINDGGHVRGSTSAMYSYGDAAIFVSGAGAMGALIHEFGHYQSMMHTEMNAEDLFFGVPYMADTQEINSQAFELLSLDYYDEIYGGESGGLKFNKLISIMLQIPNAAQIAAWETVLFYPDFDRSHMSDEEFDANMRENLGDKWYLSYPHYFISQGYYINYAVTLFDALQIYDIYLQDKKAGLDKYFEACSYSAGSYAEITKKLGLVSAFDEKADEALKRITEDIFKTEYNIDYATALDYFENGTYLGSVFPTAQRVSVNGGKPKELAAYVRNDHNYIGIREMAALLNGTSAQFDIAYNEQTGEVNIYSGRPYMPDGTEMAAAAEVKTAGQKASGTYSLLRDGKPVQRTGGSMFINGHNCYLLRGLAENGVIDIDVGYDAENNLVMITTK